MGPLVAVTSLALSQRRCFSEDTMADPERQPGPGDHVHIAAQCRSEVHEQAAQIQQAPARFKVHENVDVAVLVRVSARDGPEHGDVRGAAPCSDREQLLATSA